MRVVKEAFEHKFGDGYVVQVKKGSRTERSLVDLVNVWLDPTVFPEGPDRWRADTVGIRVPLTNTEEIEL